MRSESFACSCVLWVFIRLRVLHTAAYGLLHTVNTYIHLVRFWITRTNLQNTGEMRRAQRSMTKLEVVDDLRVVVYKLHERVLRRICSLCIDRRQHEMSKQQPARVELLRFVRRAPKRVARKFKLWIVRRAASIGKDFEQTSEWV
jgi:hypothetical protein